MVVSRASQADKRALEGRVIDAPNWKEHLGWLERAMTRPFESPPNGLAPLGAEKKRLARRRLSEAWWSDPGALLAGSGAGYPHAPLLTTVLAGGGLTRFGESLTSSGRARHA